MNKLDYLTIPETAVWTNRYSWTPVKQETEYSITGSLVVQEGVKLRGRPIEHKISMQGTTLDALYAYLTTQSNMNLTLGSESFVVRWDQSAPIESEPYVEYADPALEDWYRVTLKFIVVG